MRWPLAQLEKFGVETFTNGPPSLIDTLDFFVVFCNYFFKSLDCFFKMHTHNDYFNANLLTFCMMTSKRGHFESEVADNFLNKTMAQLHGRQLDTHGTHMRKWANSAHLVKNRAEKWPLRPQKGPFESPEAFNYSA